jgi:S-formylglutathione hydrolase FrmB
VRRLGWTAVVVLGLAPASPALAGPLRPRTDLDRVNEGLAGRVVDYTDNHGENRRLWSPALHERRSVYVYLPPGFDPGLRYPLIVWLHGFAQDEKSFLRYVVGPLDRAMACGKLAPAVVVAPDGSLHGAGCLLSAGSFFLNSDAGAFEDYLMGDVYGFVRAHYPIRPEPEAHVMAGVSMGGGAAFNKVIKYPGDFRVALGVFPPLNLRWEDCRGRYFGNFDPDCWGWRTDFTRPLQPIGRFYGVVTIRMRQVLGPLFERGDPDVTARIAAENPIEMLDRYDVRPGQLALYVAYAGKDEFNIDAQVESFLYRAKQRGLCVDVNYDAHGHHNVATARRLMPGTLDWLAARLAPYGPVP